jgi:hypothetical protein
LSLHLSGYRYGTAKELSFKAWIMPPERVKPIRVSSDLVFFLIWEPVA